MIRRLLPSTGTHGVIRSGVLFALLSMFGLPTFADTPGVTGDWDWRYNDDSSAAMAPPPPEDLEYHFILDDDGIEGAFGVTDVTGTFSRQFLWFNQFSLASSSSLELEELWVLFPVDPAFSVGDDVELVVYHDTDEDPSSGTTLLGNWTNTIQVTDGVTFSVYPLPAPLTVPDGGNLLVGVVPRFIESGVTPDSLPAAIDSTTSEGRSWIAIWSTDPPLDLALPSDALFDRIDVLTPGNWAIRAFGSQRAVIEVPTLHPVALGILMLLLGLAATVFFRRRAESD